jgi:hypothetical protein
MKVKVFTVTHSNEMEEPVNQWLHENSAIQIHHVRQSESMNNESWSMTLTIFYTPEDRKIGFQATAETQDLTGVEAQGT